MKSVDMLAIVDFLYVGETNVYQENFDSFFAIAEELQLKGLKAQMIKINDVKQNYKQGQRQNTEQIKISHIREQHQMIILMTSKELRTMH